MNNYIKRCGEACLTRWFVSANTVCTFLTNSKEPEVKSAVPLFKAKYRVYKNKSLQTLEQANTRENLFV